MSLEHLEFLFILSQDSLYSVQIYTHYAWPYCTVCCELKIHTQGTKLNAETNENRAKSFNAQFLVSLCFRFSLYTPWVCWDSYGLSYEKYEVQVPQDQPI